MWRLWPDVGISKAIDADGRQFFADQLQGLGRFTGLGWSSVLRPTNSIKVSKLAHE